MCAINLLHKNTCFGIWGFGITGKSAAQYFTAQGYSIQIMDQRKPTPQEMVFLQKNDIRWCMQETEADSFFISCDYIIVSPGININQLDYATYRHAFITELDFFYHHFQKPIIAITGSVGKTSITHILAQLCKQLSIPVAIGGNIGIGTFDLLPQQNMVDYALLEVSSFQLMHCTTFAPQLAIWTNFYPNHLDYHATEDEYFQAKYSLVKHQNNNSLSLMPFALREKLPPTFPQSTRAYFSTTIRHADLTTLQPNERVYYVENNHIIRYADTINTPIIALTPDLLNLSFIENILILASICDIMNLDITVLHTLAQTTSLPAHRIEKIATINNVIFYNDSKATTTASTLAAVQKLHDKPLHLFLGGLSKGVDRAPFVAQLKNKVKHMYCFGKEAEELYKMCKSNDIPAMHFATLTTALDACIIKLEPHDCVLFSPAGSSYDLYENYEHRGNHFKELVISYQQRRNV